MFEGLKEFLSGIGGLLNAAYIYLTTHSRTALELIASLEPTQRVVLWIQLVVGLLTIVWIIFQFAWLRRLNEARLERHLESTISSERDELADERATILAELDRVVRTRGLRRLLLFVWAQVRLTFSLTLRLLSLGTTKGVADHSLLLMKVGSEHRARAIFTEVAREAIKKVKLYKDAIDNKTIEAQNALIFAGRVAVVEGRTAAAVLLFRAAKNLKEDADARLFVGKQMSAAGAFDSAMAEYQSVVQTADASPATKSEAHRCIAEVHAKRSFPGRARTSLREAERIDREHQNHAGLAKTQEFIGDLHRVRQDRRNAALSEYLSASENYELAGMTSDARRAMRKHDRLMTGTAATDEGWWSRSLERIARWLLREVERRRARARMKAV